MKFEVTILGSSSATPIFNRNPSAQLLNINEKIFLIDCGEGTQQQMLKYGFKLNKIDIILISHLHGDHFFGLVGLVSSMNLNGRSKELYIYCHQPLKEILDLQFLHSGSTIKFPIIYHFLDEENNEELINHTNFSVSTIQLNHRIPCVGFIFKQNKTLPKINKEKVGELNISNEYFTLIKKGFDYIDAKGKVHAAHTLTTPSEEPKSYAYCSDTLYGLNNLISLHNISTLYHEATFLHEMLDRAEQTFHTTALQAAELAKQAQVEKLIIGHFSARYKDLKPLLEEASRVFPFTFLAAEGKTFEI